MLTPRRIIATSSWFDRLTEKLAKASSASDRTPNTAPYHSSLGLLCPCARRACGMRLASEVVVAARESVLVFPHQRQNVRCNIPRGTVAASRTSDRWSKRLVYSGARAIQEFARQGHAHRVEAAGCELR